MKYKISICIIFNLILSLSYSQIDKDTIIKHNNITIELTSTDSINFPDYYTNQKSIDSISMLYNNAHKLALAIEKNQLKLLNPKIKIDNKTRIITLDNDKIIKLIPNNKIEEVEFTFDKIFKKQNQILFRVQWFEGNNYCLLNTQSGVKTSTIGRTFFNPENNYLISINDDLEANYSTNGFQLFSADKNNNLKEVWSYSPNWAPTDIVWIDSNTLVAKGYLFDNEKKIVYMKVKIFVR